MVLLRRLDTLVVVHSSGTVRGVVVTVYSSPAYGLHLCVRSAGTAARTDQRQAAEYPQKETMETQPTKRTAQRMFLTMSPHGVPEMFMAANCFWTAAASVALQQEVPL